MKYITYLRNLVKAKNEEVTELRGKIQKAETADEVRALGETLDKELQELQDAQEQLTEAEKDEGNDPKEGNEPRGRVDLGGYDARGMGTLGSFGQRGTVTNNNDPCDTVEYRTAFMEYVCRGVTIPQELRATTTTTDAGAVIPTTILNEMVQKIESYGNIYAKVRKLNVQGGVAIPILSLKPEAHWIGEDKSSEDQKISATESITFSYFGLECKIAQTLLANVTTLKMFQDLFVPLAVEAIMKAMEVAIFKGSGSKQPLGILNESRIPAENVIELTDAEFGKWDQWKKKVFAKMKKSYSTGEFIMNKATFDGQIDGMVDSNGQPIGRVNYGIEGEEKYRFGGKNVETVEDFILPAYEAATAGDVVAVFVKLSDYAINSNMEMKTVKWEDHDTNEIKNKVILICDGKLVDPNGVLIIKKKA